jgi:hypothetical protein
MVERAVNFSFFFVLFVSGLLAIVACSTDEKPPKNILTQEQMATILTDVHIAESRVTKLQLKSSDSSLLVFEKLKKEIWTKHKVDTMAYRSSYDYYMTHPKQMSLIYESVNKKIEAREKENKFRP